MYTQQVRVGDVKCSQSDIGVNFQDGQPYMNLVRAFARGEVSPSDLRVRVFFDEYGTCWCVDGHRRMLAILHHYRGGGLNYTFEVDVTTSYKEFKNKHTTPDPNGGWPTLRQGDRLFHEEDDSDDYESDDDESDDYDSDDDDSDDYNTDDDDDSGDSYDYYDNDGYYDDSYDNDGYYDDSYDNDGYYDDSY